MELVEDMELVERELGPGGLRPPAEGSEPPPAASAEALGDSPVRQVLGARGR
ncbi:MAG: hypothetical protein QG608_677 [Actinomycetota bacterium]|nr:hypothetical protein [Actinomycetota bacterium]